MYTVMQGAIDKVNRIIQENLTAVRVVKSYVRGDYEKEKFDEVNDNLQTASESAFRTATLNMPAMQFIMYSTILAILWFGGNLLTVGGMKVGELTGFLSYVLQVLNSLMMFSNAFLMVTRAMGSWKRISEVMDEQIDIGEERAGDIEVRHGDIVFDHVSFKYNKDAAENVLTDISLHIEAGQTIGIIGQTGAAKSTLVQLIPRLYEAVEGTVYVDGHPVWEYPLEGLRDSIAMVLQKNTLFSGTVKDNLKWGNENATDEQIDEALEISQSKEFVDSKQGRLDYVIEQGGKNLSGGQRQRLTIARAIVRKPDVLILDDSASALDFATDAALRKAIRGMNNSPTVFIVSQRAASLMYADLIIVLDDGQVAGMGTHDELLANCEVYKEIYESQFKKADSEGGVA